MRAGWAGWWGNGGLGVGVQGWVDGLLTTGGENWGGGWELKGLGLGGCV